MEGNRTFAGIDWELGRSDGQAVQHFMSQSPWSGAAVYEQIQEEVCQRQELQQGSWLLVDESADEKAGEGSVGVGRQYNGRLGKVDQCQVSVLLALANWTAVPWPLWVLVDSELYVPEAWFEPPFAARRHKLGIPSDRSFATKPELGVQMIRRAKARGLPFMGVACDEVYGRDSQFRAQLDQEQVVYVADVPSHTQVYLQRPEVGIQSTAPGHRGRPCTQRQVLNGVQPMSVQGVGRMPESHWQTVHIRSNERGVLADRFAARRLWTWSPEHVEPRQEWLVMRVEQNGEHSYALSNAPGDASLSFLAEGCCSRYFVERAIEDGKDQAGWDEFQAQKYVAWEHHTALTACALWFIAKTKLAWAQDVQRDPHLAAQLEVDVLPALSTANVRTMLQAALPLPELSLEDAQRLVVRHLVNRSRSKASRIRRRHKAAVRT